MTSTNATAINDAGQIVGFGDFNGATHAFLPSPIPEPGAWVWMLVAAAGLPVVRRWTGRRNKG